MLADQLPDLQWAEGADGTDFKLTGTLKPEAARRVQEQALKQNITTLHNRVNELGVAEPVIQQQGADRVVVQLPGVQDTAKAKDIIGRTANLEFRLVDMSAEARAALDGSGPVPFGRERFGVGRGAPVIVKREVVASGDKLTDAQPRLDQTTSRRCRSRSTPRAAAACCDMTRDNVGKFMAAILFEKGKGEVLTVARIQGEIGNQFQITGMGTTEAANDLALLLRAGSLAAPMEIIEERTIGPSLGAENIDKGFDSVIYGFAAIALFMCAYYLLFGVFSTLALGLQPAAAGGGAVDAAGHADPARHRGHRADAGHGDRRQRADQRARARGTARRRAAAGGHPRRLRARVRRPSSTPTSRP